MLQNCSERIIGFVNFLCVRARERDSSKSVKAVKLIIVELLYVLYVTINGPKFGVKCIFLKTDLGITEVKARTKIVEITYQNMYM
jgi:hypothetical protein